MAGNGKGRGGGVTIVIKKEEVVAGSHHGGAWKVAYADFVTAMMAFFLLMWLLNATTEEQRRGLADYFAPNNVLGRTVTGSGQPFGGRTVNSAGDLASDNGMVRVERGPTPVRVETDEEEADGPAEQVPQPLSASDRPPRALGATSGPPRSPVGTASLSAEQALVGAAAARLVLAAPTQEAEAPASHPASQHMPGQHPAGTAPSGEALAADPLRPTSGPRPGQLQAMVQGNAQAVEAARLADTALRAELGRRERAGFEQAAEELRVAVRDDPALADLARHLRIEQVPEGLRIQILDSDRRPMFPLASSVATDRARALILKVAQVAARLPNGVAIAGHTDATPFRGEGRTNWDLSADRANAVRRLLNEGGINPARMHSVSGHAEREPLLPADPGAAGNRRVAITLLRTAPPAAGEAQP